MVVLNYGNFEANDYSCGMKKNNPSTAGWDHAVKLCVHYSEQPGKADWLLNENVSSITSDERRYCQFLFLGVVRHLRRIDGVMDALIAKRPRPKLVALLHVSILEIMMKGDAEFPKIVDFCVGKAKQMLSAKEAGLVNAVLRKVPAQLQQRESLGLGERYSHPDWLVERWRNSFGDAQVSAMLDWNQQAPQVYARWTRPSAAVPEVLQSSRWPDFYTVQRDGWRAMQPLLAAGDVYIQDPSTRLAPELLAVQPGESVLDLCAAPGGKSAFLIQALGRDRKGCLVALDKPGPRIEQLDENLKKCDDTMGPEVHLVVNDLMQADVADLGKFDAVLLDAPCSNTGVLQRRPDAKWRLQPDSIAAMAKVQAQLLRKAAAFVRPGGRLVYSTCSIEPEENERIATVFVAKHGNFELVDFVRSYPWETGHDGAGAFLLRKKTRNREMRE